MSFMKLPSHSALDPCDFVYQSIAVSFKQIHAECVSTVDYPEENETVILELVQGNAVHYLSVKKRFVSNFYASVWVRRGQSPRRVTDNNIEQSTASFFLLFD